jgi:predicted RNA-binding protein with PIN domain
VAADVRTASQAAAALARALDAVAGRLEPEAPELPVRRRPRTGGPPTRRPRRGLRPRRVPARLPPAVLEDSAEATEFLVRLPDVLLLVDGYNVSKAAWPDCTLEDQRERLAVALDTLHARTGVHPLVIFDGVAAGGPPPGTVPISRATRVRFTDSGVEADDVVLDLVDDVAPARPVVVASSDRRVQAGARARGANVLSTAQLLAALRR